MTPMNEKPTDEQILAAVGIGCRPTYVVRNWLASRSFGFKALKTPWVLRQLKRLEKAGKVRRIPSSYAVMICWEVVP